MFFFTPPVRAPDVFGAWIRVEHVLPNKKVLYRQACLPFVSLMWECLALAKVALLVRMAKCTLRELLT